MLVDLRKWSVVMTSNALQMAVVGDVGGEAPGSAAVGIGVKWGVVVVGVENADFVVVVVVVAVAVVVGNMSNSPHYTVGGGIDGVGNNLGGGPRGG